MKERCKQHVDLLIYEYKLSETKQQYAALDEAIRVVQFIRNKSLRLWMNKAGTSKNDLQTNCAVLWSVNTLSPNVSTLKLVKRFWTDCLYCFSQTG